MRSLPVLSLVACLSMPAMAMAQDAQDTLDHDDPLEVHGDEILVMAPRMLGQIDMPQQPIEVLDEEDIAAYGVNSIQELLDAISPQTGSGRGRGDGRPVMLLNGQRISSPREMRNIPPEAIRRLEVLPEEVALRFGYAANQRVVNIILKDKFASVTAAGEYNVPTRGGYDNFELEGGLFRISGPRRYNVNAKLAQSTMLTEDERNILQEPSRLPTVAGDPDPARYRSLSPSSSELVLEGTMTQGLGENGLGGSITVTGGYTRSQTRSLNGLDTVTLSYDGDSEVRTLADPLSTKSLSDSFEAGLGYNTMVMGDWDLSATSNLSVANSTTRVDRRRDTQDLIDAAADGRLSIAGALPFLPGSGVDVSETRQMTVTNLATLSGKPFRMPAGNANLTVKAGYNFNRSVSEDTRNSLGEVVLKRGDVQGGVNLLLPLTSKADDFLGAVGDITLNLSGGIHHLSDFGTLTNWSAGATWSPTEKLTFQASYLVEEDAPKLTQLAAPNVVTYNVAVYDFTNSTTALVTSTSGGNPNLKKEKQRDWKISAQWQLPFFSRSNLMVEYFRNRSTDVSQSFPLLTPAIEAAFPDRVTRDAYGNLIAIDRRAVTFDEVKSSSLRWGFNFSGSLGGSSSSGSGSGGTSGAPRSGGDAGLARGAGQSGPVVGAAGPMPAVQTLGAAPAAGGGFPAFDPARFTAARQQLCANGANVDPASLPDGLRQRLTVDDGKIDATKLEAFKSRSCAADGTPLPDGPREGGPREGGPRDPARFEAMRTALCGNTSETPDLSALPDRMRERLIGADGKIDQQALSETRARMCSADGPPAPPAGEGARPNDFMRMMGPPPAGGPAGGAPGSFSTRSGAGSSGGPGGPGGMGGPGMGGGRGPGSRWNLAVYHTWRFTDTVKIASGVPIMDALAGDAIASGGVPRHAIEAEGGLFKNGYGLRLKGKWEAPATVNGSGAPGSQDLRFGSTFDLSLRTFADLGRNADLVAKYPLLKGTRVSFVVDNLLDSRQKVTDQSGNVPIAYQRAYREPQGRVIGIDIRKMF